MPSIFSLHRVDDLMRDYTRPWWIAGGWAIDLFLGYESRAHQDIDVAILRRDQAILRRHFVDGRFTKMVHGVPHDWPEHERLELPIHEIYVEHNGERLEFLLNEAADEHWLFRRNLAVSAPLACVTRRTTDGLPYLAPEIVLLYKAKSPRDKDRADFERVLPKLEPDARLWLANALRVCHPSHAWLDALDPRSPGA